MSNIWNVAAICVNDTCQISVQCTFLKGSVPFTSFVAYICTYIPCICMVRICIFGFWQYWAKTGEVEVAVGSVWPIYVKILGPHAHLACRQCELYLNVAILFVQ